MAVVATFDFADFDVPTLEVKLKDKERTVLNVKLPGTGVYDAMKEFNEKLPKLTDEDANEILYALIAVILSNNKEDKKITSEYLQNDCENTDYDAMFAFFMAFTAYVEKQTEIKN